MTGINNNIRVVPRDGNFLDRRKGARGEIYFDQNTNSLRLYDGRITGGVALATTNGPETLTNKNIVDRVVEILDSNSVTININNTDTATQSNTQPAGTLTINAPTGIPVDGQKIVFRLQSSNIQTFLWDPIFAGSEDLELPSESTGNNKYDYMGFIYNGTSQTWQILAKNFNF